MDEFHHNLLPIYFLWNKKDEHIVMATEYEGIGRSHFFPPLSIIVKQCLQVFNGFYGALQTNADWGDFLE